MNEVTKIAAIVAVMAVLMAAAVRVQAERERRYPSGTTTDTNTNTSDGGLYVTSGSVARRLSLAYAPLAADLYWIRAVQYYGGMKRRLAAQPPALMPPPALAADAGVQYPQLYPLLDLTTTLDPAFNVAYRFGAVFLAEPFPNGPGRPDLAVALLEKGLHHRPDKWEYMQDIGFVHYWYGQDYGAAAAWFEKASRVPGAPWWLKSLAATTLAQGGDRRSSRQMWTAIRESAEVDWLRRDAERRLAQLRALDEIEQLQREISDFLTRIGQRTTTWQALVRERVVPGMMADPTGTPYELTPDGVIRLSQASPLWPLPVEPQSTRPRSGA
jgi:hypothetical protein